MMTQPKYLEGDGLDRLLTVIAVGTGVRRHRAVAGVVLPLLDADAHVGARVLLARGARTCGGKANAMKYRVLRASASC